MPKRFKGVILKKQAFEMTTANFNMNMRANS